MYVLMNNNNKIFNIIYYWFPLLYDQKNNYADLGGYYPLWPSASEANTQELAPNNHLLVMYEFSTQTIVL